MVSFLCYFENLWHLFKFTHFGTRLKVSHNHLKIPEEIAKMYPTSLTYVHAHYKRTRKMRPSIWPLELHVPHRPSTHEFVYRFLDYLRPFCSSIPAKRQTAFCHLVVSSHFCIVVQSLRIISEYHASILRLFPHTFNVSYLSPRRPLRIFGKPLQPLCTSQMPRIPNLFSRVSL